jgi:hypothetical protein
VRREKAFDKVKAHVGTRRSDVQFATIKLAKKGQLFNFFVSFLITHSPPMEAEAEKRKQRLQALRKRKLQSEANDQTNGEK